jgi:hypothetical protein
MMAPFVAPSFPENKYIDVFSAWLCLAQQDFVFSEIV